MNVVDLIKSGLKVVSVPYKEKGPKVKGWNLPQNAISTPLGATALIGNNVGLAHAYCTPSPTCSIDVDDYLQAKPWLAEQGIYLDLLLGEANAVVISSGKGNSIKLLHRLPTGIKPLVSKQLLNSGGKMMLEFRCAAQNGTTVQDLIPPSVHPSGTQYRWVGSGTPLDIPIIPANLLQLWLNLLTTRQTCSNSSRQKRRPCSKQFQLFNNTPPAESPLRVAVLKLQLTHIKADCDRSTWRNIVWAILNTGWSCAIEIAEEWSKSAPNHFQQKAFDDLVRDFSADLANPVTLGTVVFFARKGGWIG
jgi:putative DNA primase/helicase